MKLIHLEITGNHFTKRNINNFLRLCQKLPTDVQNSEMKDICEIAKLFKAEGIYNTGLTFINTYLDPNFFVSDDKCKEYDIKIVENKNFIQNNSMSKNNFFRYNSKRQNQENIIAPNSNIANNKQDYDLTNQLTNNNTIIETNKSDITNNDKIEQIIPEISEENQKTIFSNNNNTNINKSVIYFVRVENHTFKCPIFKFVNNEKIVFTAKQKLNDIFIGKGGEIHIRDKQNHVAHICQHEVDQFNKIHIGNTQFRLKYVNSGQPGRISIEVTFPFNDKNYTMKPKMPKYDFSTSKYYLDCYGDYQNVPMISSRNIVLQNEEVLTNFIVRKMDLNLYEIECNQILDPLIAFTIGLSDIVGPFNNPYANVDYND